MGVMNSKTVDILLETVFHDIEAGGNVSFAFQGGEPTVAGLPFFHSFVKKAKERCPSGVSISFSIQTNGILVDEEWASFFCEHDFLVGLSIDGEKQLHDLYRVDQQGKGTWARLCRTLALLQKKKDRVNVLCVVTAQCAKHPDKVYQSLKKLGAEFIQFIPCLDPLGEQRGLRTFSLKPDLYGQFLCRLFDLYYRDWERNQYHSIRFFEDHIHLLLGNQPVTCATCGQCGSYFVIEGDGSIYPCDFYVTDEWKIGQLGVNTLTEISQTIQNKEFLAWGCNPPPECMECQWRRLCNGGCKRDWVNVQDVPHNYYCKAFQMLFAYSEERLMLMLQAEIRARKRH